MTLEWDWDSEADSNSGVRHVLHDRDGMMDFATWLGHFVFGVLDWYCDISGAVVFERFSEAFLEFLQDFNKFSSSSLRFR